MDLHKLKVEAQKWPPAMAKCCIYQLYWSILPLWTQIKVTSLQFKVRNWRGNNEFNWKIGAAAGCHGVQQLWLLYIIRWNLPQLPLSLNPKGYYGCSRCFNHGLVWAHGPVCNYQFIWGWNTFILMVAWERLTGWEVTRFQIVMAVSCVFSL